MTVQLIKPPANVPGQGMTELIKDVTRIALSTTLSVSTTMSTDITLFSVPANTFVYGIAAEVTTAVDGGSSDVGLTVGDTASATALLTLELSSVLAVNTVGTLCKNYTAATDIHAYFTPGEGVTGGLRFWLQYRTDSDVQEVG